MADSELPFSKYRGLSRARIAVVCTAIVFLSIASFADSAPLLSGSESSVSSELPMDEFGFVQGSLPQAQCLARCYKVDAEVSDIRSKSFSVS